MTLRERWTDLPRDARLGYAAAGCFGLWHSLLVAAGPLLTASAWLVYPAVAGVGLFGVTRLIQGPRRMVRLFPVALLSAYLTTFVCFTGELTTDLHVIARVYLAGDPGAVSKWGQGLILEQQRMGKNLTVEGDQVPNGIRNYLSYRADVSGSLCSTLPRVRTELGGGFYHFGVLVWPSDLGPDVQWWQRALGWPPEVMVYHEE